MSLQGAISMAAPSASSIAGIGAGASAAAPIGAILGAGMSGIGMLANAISSRKAFKRQKELMQLQAKLNYQYNRTQTMEQYKWQRKGLESANYNPLLALQGANSVSAQNWSGSPSSPMADFTGFASDFANSTDKILQQQMFKSNLENIASQTSLNKSNVGLNSAKYDNYVVDTGLKGSQTALNMLEAEYLPEKLKSEIHRNIVGARADLMNAQANQISANASQVSANAQRIKADSDVKLQEQTVQKFKTEMKLTDQQTENMRQIYKWYGFEKGTQMILQLSEAGYFGTGALRNLNNIKNDDINTLTGVVNSLK